MSQAQAASLSKKERKRGLTPQSAKAKGRNLQKATRDKIIATFPNLTLEDVRSTSMGCGGVDLQLSTHAGNVFPFCVECKNVENLQLWKSLEQAEANAAEFNETRSPKSKPRSALLVFKKNGTEIFVCLQHHIMADALKSAAAASLGLVDPKHFEERVNIWSKIDDAVTKGLKDAQVASLATAPRSSKKQGKVAPTKERKRIMRAFTCTFSRQGTPKYVLLSLDAFLTLISGSNGDATVSDGSDEEESLLPMFSAASETTEADDPSLPTVSTTTAAAAAAAAASFPSSTFSLMEPIEID